MLLCYDAWVFDYISATGPAFPIGTGFWPYTLAKFFNVMLCCIRLIVVFSVSRCSVLGLWATMSVLRPTLVNSCVGYMYVFVSARAALISMVHSVITLFMMGMFAASSRFRRARIVRCRCNT